MFYSLQCTCLLFLQTTEALGKANNKLRIAGEKHCEKEKIHKQKIEEMWQKLQKEEEKWKKLIEEGEKKHKDELTQVK